MIINSPDLTINATYGIVKAVIGMKNSRVGLEPPVVGIYKRVSTQEQADSGHSLDDQERVCREYLDRVYGSGGYRVEVFADEGFSGKLGFARPGSSAKKVRPGLSALVKAIADGQVSVVIFWRFDRLSRSARVWFEFLQDYLLKNDIALISINEDLDTRSPMGRFAAGILVLAAELFADITSENVRSAMKRRRADGYPTGRAGFGWQHQGRADENG